MAIAIPLTRPIIGGARSVSLPLLPALGGNKDRDITEDEVVAAVTGGVAISDPKRALELGRLDREKGESVIAPNINDSKLQALFDAVDDAKRGEGKSSDIKDADRQVARVLRVDAGLVAAARITADADASVCKAGIDWAGSINAQRLAEAARVGVNETQRDRIPTQKKKIENLDDRLDGLAKDLKDLTKTVSDLAQKVDGLANAAQPAGNQGQAGGKK